MEPVTLAPDRPAAEAGFSLVEVLIAAVLLLVVILGLLPLFAASMANNVAGREYSVASHHGRSRIEALTELPMDREALEVAAGLDERRLSERYDPATDRFTAGAPSQPPRWLRTTVVRQYNVSDLYDGGRLVNPLPGGTPPNHVHLREVVVEVESERGAGAPLGEGRSVTLSTVKGF